VARSVPPAPAPLDLPQRQLLLRLGAFATLAGDEPRLQSLRRGYAARVAGGPLAESFVALLGEPGGAPTTAKGRPDLAQLRREIQAARGLQEQLRTLR
jgi:hypothetical protein